MLLIFILHCFYFGFEVEALHKLKIGLSKIEVLNILGEPYMTQAGYISRSSNIEILTFKLRVKYYPNNVNEKKPSWNMYEPNKTSTTDTQQSPSDLPKPPKFASVGVWGEFYTLVCEFKDDSLIRWSCPELQEKYNTPIDTIITR